MADTLAEKEVYTSDDDNINFAYSFLPGLLFVALLSLLSLLSYLTGADLVWLGIEPRNFFGLIGIVMSPLIHSDLLHLLSNSFPLILLSGFILYLHRNVAIRVMVLVYVLSGILTWFIGRPSYHIGASGVVYGLAGFLLFNGFLSHNRSAMAVSLAVLFLYSGLFYGLLPTEERISWEGHLAGFVAGLISALVYGEGLAKNIKPTYIEPNIVQRHVSNTIGPHYKHMHINYQILESDNNKPLYYTLNPSTGKAFVPTHSSIKASITKRKGIG
jgi:membrane associated rhomboid family serine protease